MFPKILLTFHFIFALITILLVLLQKDQGAEGGGVIGLGGASQTLFGSQGSGSFMTRLTGIIAGLFFLTSLSLSVLNPNAHLADLTRETESHSPIVTHNPSDAEVVKQVDTLS